MTATMRPLSLEAIAAVAVGMRQRDREEIFATRHQDDPLAIAREVMATSVYGAVAFSGEWPVAVVCTGPMWPGVWHVGMFATDRWPAVALSTYRWCRKVLWPMLWKSTAHRVECRSLASHIEAHRFIRALGGTWEATHREYGRAGQDFEVYVWRRDRHVLQDPGNAEDQDAGATAYRDIGKRADAGGAGAPPPRAGKRAKLDDPDLAVVGWRQSAAGPVDDGR